MARARVALLCILLLACDDGATGPRRAGLPSDVHIVGTAAGPRGDGGSIDCGFDIRVSLAESRRTPAFIEYTGTMGGEARRKTLDSTQAGFEFWADVAWPNVVARLVGQDSLEFLMGDTTANDGRFWHENAFLAGARQAGDPGSGVWICAPLDIYQGGYVDTIGVVQGSWQIQ